MHQGTGNASRGQLLNSSTTLRVAWEDPFWAQSQGSLDVAEPYICICPIDDFQETSLLSWGDLCSFSPLLCSGRCTTGCHVCLQVGDSASSQLGERPINLQVTVAISLGTACQACAMRLLWPPALPFLLTRSMLPPSQPLSWWPPSAHSPPLLSGWSLCWASIRCQGPMGMCHWPAVVAFFGHIYLFLL